MDKENHLLSDHFSELDQLNEEKYNDEIQPNFQPFMNERNATGKLRSRAQMQSEQKTRAETLYSDTLTFQPTGKVFNFLKGQQKVLIQKGSVRQNKSTTALLGLSQQKKILQRQNPQLNITKSDKAFQQNFQLKMSADQGFIKNFGDNSKKKLKSQDFTRLQSAFLTTFREQHERDSNTPGPGIYQIQNLPYTQPQGDLQFAKRTNFYDLFDEKCKVDFYDHQDQEDKIKYTRIISVPEFNRIISRDEAYQKGIFYQIEKQKREGQVRQKDAGFNEAKINKEIEYQRNYQKKYSKPFGVPKMYELAVSVKRLPKPEIFHNQYSKMLERYGFKNRRGKLMKQKMN